MAQSKGKIYSDSSMTIKESVMNIRTVLSLAGPSVMDNRYKNQLSEVINVISGKALLSGAMYGLSALLQFVSFGLIFFLAAVYINNYNLGIDGSLEAIFLILFAGVSAGNNSNFMPDVSNAKTSAKYLFSLIDLEN